MNSRNNFGLSFYCSYYSRHDISSQITPTLIGKFDSINWKERKEALDDVEQILRNAGNRIMPSTGDLFSALKGRMSDSNRNLTAQALRVVTKLASAMGQPIDKQGRVVVEPALNCITDNKHQVCYFL